MLPGKWSIEDYEEVSAASILWDEKLDSKGEFPANPSVQALWDAPLYQKKYEELLKHQTAPAEKARLLAVASENASDWLNAVPVPTLGLKLDNFSMRPACGCSTV